MLATETVPAVKEIKPINFLYFRTEALLHQLSNYIPVSKDLFKEAVRYDLQITGPIHWHYFGFSGDEMKSFTLEIALPVADVIASYDGSFHFKRTGPFKCASLVHEGAWATFPESYSRLNEFIARENLEPVSMIREIYVNADLNHPEANVTEIQIGVK